MPGSDDLPLRQRKMNRLRIGVFDSGLGGLSVLRLLPAALPDAELIYLADSGRAPYGARTKEEIREFSFQIAESLIEDYGVQMLLIACNTATAAAAENLREHFHSLPIIGMEPAVKPAAKSTRSGVIGVMATAGTIGSDRYAELLARYGSHLTVLEDPCLGLVALIEAGHFDDELLKEKLSSIIEPMREARADVIVLGCTHFPLVADSIAEVAGSGFELIDPAPAVVSQVLRRLEQVDGHALAKQPAFVFPKGKQYLFLSSGEPAGFGESLKRLVPDLLDRALIKPWNPDRLS